MPNKFLDYLASYYDRQQTVLEQLELVKKYLVKNPTVNMFISTQSYTQSDNVLQYRLDSIYPQEKQAYSGDLVFFNNGYIGMINSLMQQGVYQAYTIDKASVIHPVKGEKGDTGATGGKGDKGDTGATGADGANGTRYYFAKEYNFIINHSQTVTAFVPRLPRPSVNDIFIGGNGVFANIISKVSDNEYTAIGQVDVSGKDGNGIISITAGTPVNVDGKTVTPIDIVTDDETFSLGIQAQNGSNGQDGQRGLTGTGISHITQGTPYVSGENTITPLTVEYTDGTDQSLSVTAKNGKSSGKDVLYCFLVSLENKFFAITIPILSTLNPVVNVGNVGEMVDMFFQNPDYQGDDVKNFSTISGYIITGSTTYLGAIKFFELSKANRNIKVYWTRYKANFEEVVGYTVNVSSDTPVTIVN